MKLFDLLPSYKLIEKCTKFEYFMFLLSIALYFDNYLVMFKKINLLHLNWLWLKDNIVLGDVVLLVLVFLFLISAIAPGLRLFGAFVTLYLVKFIDKTEYKSNHYLRPNTFREYAILKNNLAAFKEFERVENKMEYKERLMNYCILLAILILLNCIYRSEHYRPY